MLEQLFLTLAVDNIAGLVVAIGALLGAVAGILGALVPWIKRLNVEAGEKAAIVAESLKETDHWILENQEKIKTVAAVVTNLSPEAKKLLEEQGINIVALTEDLQKTKEELERLHAVLPEPQIATNEK